MNGSEAALVARVGVDLSKRVYQVHAVDRSGKVLLAKAMSPERFLAWCRELAAGCMVATEALCSDQELGATGTDGTASTS